MRSFFIGSLILLIGVWFEFAAFTSGDPSIPISWQMFIIADFGLVGSLRLQTKLGPD